MKTIWLSFYFLQSKIKAAYLLIYLILTFSSTASNLHHHSPAHAIRNIKFLQILYDCSHLSNLAVSSKAALKPNHVALVSKVCWNGDMTLVEEKKILAAFTQVSPSSFLTTSSQIHNSSFAQPRTCSPIIVYHHSHHHFHFLPHHVSVLFSCLFSHHNQMHFTLAQYFCRMYDYVHRCFV